MPCSCCAAESLDIFGEKSARRELRRYLRKGLGGDDAKLIAAWAEEGGLDGATVAEVGGGIGQVQAELLRRAPRQPSSSSSRGTRPPRQSSRGRSGRRPVSFVLADLLTTPDAVAPADIVILRRVVVLHGARPSPARARRGEDAPRAARELSASTPSPPARSRAREPLPRPAPQAVPVVRPSPEGLDREAARHGLRRTRTARGAVWETAHFDVGSSDAFLTNRSGSLDAVPLVGACVCLAIVGLLFAIAILSSVSRRRGGRTLPAWRSGCSRSGSCCCRRSRCRSTSSSRATGSSSPSASSGAAVRPRLRRRRRLARSAPSPRSSRSPTASTTGG